MKPSLNFRLNNKMIRKGIFILSSILFSSIVFSQNSLTNLSNWDKESICWLNKNMLDTLREDLYTFPVPIRLNDTLLISNLKEQFDFILTQRSLYIDFIDSVLQKESKLFIVERFYNNFNNQIDIFANSKILYRINFDITGSLFTISEERNQQIVNTEFRYWVNKEVYGFDEWVLKNPIGDLIIISELEEVGNDFKYKIFNISF